MAEPGGSCCERLNRQNRRFRTQWNRGPRAFFEAHIGRLFSTETADAWLLDPADRLAARLARDGESEPIHIEETDATFAIGWKGRYRIEVAAFVYADNDSGRVTTILGYPTDQLARIR